MAKAKQQAKVLEDLGFKAVDGTVTRLGKGFPKPLSFRNKGGEWVEIIYFDVISGGTFYKVSIRDVNLVKSFETGKFWDKLTEQFVDFELPKKKSQVVVRGKLQLVQKGDRKEYQLTVWDDKGFRLCKERPDLKKV